MYRRIAQYLAAAAVTTTALLGLTTPAHAYSSDEPNPKAANGQARAVANCEENVLKQENNEIWPGGGPKTASPFPGPTNCDHYYQDVLEVIGNN